jgi:hypothetical protein
MSVKITNASFGDERSSTDVTANLAEMIKSKGSIDVPVNSSLVPVFGKGATVQLTSAEQKEAKEKAVNLCGNSNDDVCVKLKTQEFEQTRLQEKMRETQSFGNLIKGRRLVVKYVDEKGKPGYVEVPEGQTFKLGTPPTTAPFSVDVSKLSSVTGSGVVVSIFKYLGIAVGVFVYAFSILITWRSFALADYTTLKYVATAASVVLPYSGFFITLIFFGLEEFVKNLPIPNKNA